MRYYDFSFHNYYSVLVGLMIEFICVRLLHYLLFELGEC